MLTVGKAVGGTGGSLARIHDLGVSRGRQDQLLRLHQTAVTANNSRRPSLLRAGGGYERQNLKVVGGSGGDDSLLAAAEGTDSLHTSHLGTGGRDNGIPLAENVGADRGVIGVIGRRIHTLAGNEAQRQHREEQPQGKYFFRSHITNLLFFLIIAHFGGADMKNRKK
jgi:hypothetical protein